MYIIIVHDKDKNKLSRISRFGSLKIELGLNKENRASFSVVNTDEYDSRIFKKKNVIQIYRNSILKFEGVVTGTAPKKTSIEIECESYSNILKGRSIDNTFTGTYDSVISSIFSSGASSGAIPVTLEKNVTGNISLELEKSSVFDGLEAMKSGGKDYFFREDKIEVSDFIGEDKSSTIVLRFYEKRSYQNNIKNYSLREEGSDIVNIVEGYKDGIIGSPVSIQNDDSITEYGPFKKQVNFSEASDLSTLTILTSEYLKENKDETLNIDFSVYVTKIDTEDINIGDLVKVEISKGYTDISKTLRVIGKTYTVNGDSSFSEDITFNVVYGTKEIKGFFDTLADMKKRLSDLEKK